MAYGRWSKSGVWCDVKRSRWGFSGMAELVVERRAKIGALVVEIEERVCTGRAKSSAPKCCREACFGWAVR